MLIVGTGVLLAAADAGDRNHDACRALLESEDGPLVSTALVVAETGYLLDRQLGPSAEAGLYRALARGEIRVEALDAPALDRIAELIDQYADLPLGGTDASLVVLMERFEERRIATLDRRHFSVVQPRSGPVEILPA